MVVEGALIPRRGVVRAAGRRSPQPGGLHQNRLRCAPPTAGDAPGATRESSRRNTLSKVKRSEFWAGREPVGCAVAVIAAPLVLWFYMNLFFGGRWTDGDLLGYCFALGGPFALLTMLLFGVPVLRFLKARGKTGPLALALGGALAGGAAYFTMVVVLAFSAWNTPAAPFTLEQLAMYALGALTGAHCGLCHYFVAHHPWHRERTGGPGSSQEP